jgi:hypothetical protein
MCEAMPQFLRLDRLNGFFNFLTLATVKVITWQALVYTMRAHTIGVYFKNGARFNLATSKFLFCA